MKFKQQFSRLAAFLLIFLCLSAFAGQSDGLTLVGEAGLNPGVSLKGGARWNNQGPNEKYLSFDGKIGSHAEFLLGPEFDSPQELSLSFWFLLEKRPVRELIKQKQDCATVISRNWSWSFRVYPSMSACARMITEKKEEDAGGGNISLNAWNHVVITYSFPKKRFCLYLNGSLIAERRDLATLKKLSGPLLLGEDHNHYNNFNGRLCGVKIFSRMLSKEEATKLYQKIPLAVLATPLATLQEWQQGLETIDRSKLNAEALKQLEAALQEINTALRKKDISMALLVETAKIRIENMLNYPHARTVLLNWNKILKKIGPEFLCDKIGKELDRQDFSAVEFVSSNTLGVEAYLERRVVLKDTLCFIIPPLSATPLVPDTQLDLKELGTDLSVTLPPGEYEPVSFVLRPLRNLTGVRFSVPSLEDGHGQTIPAENLDLKNVLCWYQAGSAWESILQNTAVRLLVPELLVNDPALVKVDQSKQTNDLRLSFPDGEKYVSICHPEKKDTRTRWKMSIKTQEYPVRDAATLQPVSLPANENQQFFLMVKAPDNIAPGTYTGRLIVTSDQGKIGSIEITVKLLPFRLAEPKTNYDMQRDFVPSIYHVSLLDPKSKGDITPHHRTLAEYRNELNNLSRHGINNPLCYQMQIWNLDEFRRVLKLRQEAGLKNQPLFLSGPESNLGEGLADTPEGLDRIRKKVKQILDIVQEVCGHRDVYFYGIDERRGDDLQKQRQIWQTIHDVGGKSFVSCNDLKGTNGKGSFDLVGDILDLVIYTGVPLRSEAAKWHEKNHRIWSYGNPQGGVENPEVYRRNYGLLLYLNNYDGFATYCYYEAFGNPWDDFDFPYFRDHNLVYPTADGVVDTIAWEGYREAVDDIRYATTLREAAATAHKSGNPAKISIAVAAEEWLQNIDAEYANLDVVRSMMIQWILKLRK